MREQPAVERGCSRFRGGIGQALQGMSPDMWLTSDWRKMHGGHDHNRKRIDMMREAIGNPKGLMAAGISGESENLAKAQREKP